MFGLLLKKLGYLRHYLLDNKFVWVGLFELGSCK